MNISINRKGKFKVESGNEGWCGSVGQTDYRYEFSITGSGKDKKDWKGFLVDHDDVDYLFQRIKLATSGESMAEDLVKIICDFCEEDGFKPSKVSVKIIPSDEVFFYAEA